MICSYYREFVGMLVHYIQKSFSSHLSNPIRYGAVSHPVCPDHSICVTPQITFHCTKYRAQKLDQHFLLVISCRSSLQLCRFPTEFSGKVLSTEFISRNFLESGPQFRTSYRHTCKVPLHPALFTKSESPKSICTCETFGVLFKSLCPFDSCFPSIVRKCVCGMNVWYG